MDTYVTEKELSSIRRLLHRIDVEDLNKQRRANRIPNLSRQVSLILSKAERRSRKWPVV